MTLEPIYPEGPLLRAPEELDDPNTRVESALPVRTARVVIADYAALQHDFGQLREASLAEVDPRLRSLSPPRREQRVRSIIDRWLLHHAAVISTRQLAPNDVNTPISTLSAPLVVWRPPRYGRSLVVPVAAGAGRAPEGASPWSSATEGLLDVKGAGIAQKVTATSRAHGNGLLGLDEALEELVIQRLIAAIFHHAGVEARTVPSYAVLDLGFEILWPDGRRVPAGSLIRRAHRRPLGGAELPPIGSSIQRTHVEIEMLLRVYGVTSANSLTQLVCHSSSDPIAFTYGGQPADIFSQPELRRLVEVAGIETGERFEGTNIQCTRETGREGCQPQLVDFGHYEVRERFTAGVVSMVRDTILRWGGVLRPGDPAFVQPDPALAVPVEHWGAADPAERSGDRPRLTGSGRCTNVLSSDWAFRFSRGELDRAGVEKCVDRLLETATRRWDDRVAEPTDDQLNFQKTC